MSTSRGRCPKCDALEECTGFERGDIRWCRNKDCFILATLAGEPYWVRKPELEFIQDAEWADFVVQSWRKRLPVQAWNPYA